MKAILRFAALFLLLLSSSAAFAQAQPATPDSVRLAAQAHRNIVRVDGLVLLTRSLSYLLDGGQALPLLLGYERQVGQNVSGNLEVLLDAGNAKEQITGLALQMRYYIPSPRYPTALTGFYVGPMIGSRLIKRDYLAHFIFYTPSGYIQRRMLGGAGGLIGRQTSVGKRGRVLFDASLGLMGWKQLNNSSNIPAGCPSCTDKPTRYEATIFIPDGRFSVGYRF